jgi:hypothetical protein
MLATWRVSYMLTTEDCPFKVCVFIRKHLNIGGVLDCIYCTSVWIAGFLLLIWYSPLYPIVYVLSISAFVIAFHQFVKALQAYYFYVFGEGQ